MPVLGRATKWEDGTDLLRGAAGGWRLASSLFPSCANPLCSSSWLHLWRSRQTPVFEGGWSCSEECTLARINVAIRKERDGQQAAPVEHRHRVPLGLVMLAQGWITQAQLKSALQSQRAAGSGRLGSWLIRDARIDEHQVTRALSLQWNCPVFSMETAPGPELGSIVPRLLAEAFGILPIRVAGGKLLYVGFEDRIDRCVTFALERMTGLRVEAGLVDTSAFVRAHSCLLEEALFPPARLIEAVDAGAMAQALARVVEKAKPTDARLVRVHDCFWLRLWHGPQSWTAPCPPDGIEDVICSIGAVH